MIIQLNIGSNIGDRYAQIEQAVALLSIAFRVKSPQAEIYRSTMIESEPWGFESENRFLNLGLMIKTPVDMAPLDVLEITRATERIINIYKDSHRNADGSYRDRRIDIDIIDIDGIKMQTPELTLPHPYAAARQFVSIPRQELEKYASGSRPRNHS